MGGRIKNNRRQLMFMGLVASLTSTRRLANIMQVMMENSKTRIALIHLRNWQKDDGDEFIIILNTSLYFTNI